MAAGWAALPVSVSLQGVVGELQQALVKPTEQAAKAAGAAINKNIAPEVDKLDKAVRSAQYRQKKATDEQIAAERKLVDAKSKAEQAVRAVEAAEANRAVAVSKAGTKVADAEAKYKAVLSDSKSTAEQVERAEQALNNARSAEKSTILTQENKLASARDKSRTAALGVEKAEQGVVDAMSEAKRAADSLEKKQKSLKDAQDGVSDSAAEMGDEIAKAGEDAKSTGGMFDGMVTKLGAVGAAVAGIAGASGFAMLGKCAADAASQVNNQLGLTGQAAEGVRDSINEVMRSGVAGSAEEAASAVGSLESQFKYLGFEGEQTAAALADNFLGFTQTFGVDMEEAVQTAGQLIQNGLASDVENAADLMTTAMQRVPAQMRDELPEIINEYGTNFRALGFSGEEAFGLLVSASEKGKWALDKTGDALKEFTIRGSDMSEASKTAFSAIGLDAQDMSNKIAEGGAGARQALEDTAKGILAIEDPAERANTAIALFGTPLEDLSVDQIPQFLDSLTGAEDSMSGFAGSSQELGDSVKNSLDGRLNALKGTLTALASDAFMAVWDVVQFKIIPAVSNLGNVWQSASRWVEDNKGKLLGFAAAVSPVLVPLLVGLGIHWTALGTKATLSAVSQVRAWAVTKAEAIKSAAISLVNLWKLGAGWIATGAQAMLGAGRVAAAWAIAKAQAAGALVASIAAVGAGWIATGARALIGAGQVAAAWVIGLGPIAWVTAAIAAVVGALTWFFTQTETGKAVWASFTSFLSSAWQATVDALIGAWNWVKTTVIDAWNFAWAGVQANWALLTGALSSGWTWLKDTFVAVWTWIKTAVLDAWNAYWAQVQVNFQILTGGLMAAWTWVKDSFVMVWNIVKTAVLDAWNLYWGLVQSGFQITMNALTGAWNWMKDMLSAGWNFIRDAVINAFQNALNAFRGVFQGIMNALSGSWDFLKNALMAGWNWINSNVLGGFRSGLDGFKGFFSSVVDGIKGVWDSLRGALAKPINFMINTVYNGGILKAWNVIAGILPGLKKGNPLAGIPEHAVGGAIRGPGSGTSDDVLMWGSNGEHMWTAKEVREVGGQASMYAMRKMVGSHRPFSWDGEKMVPLPTGARGKHGDLLGAAPELFPKYKNGGEIRPMWEIQLERGHAWAQSRSGRPYVLGGSANGGGGTDCSGFMSGIANVIQGGDGARQWATMAFNGGGNSQHPSGPQGFVAGLAKGFSIGVTNGGAAGGHTAGTLSGVGRFGTTNVESGGSPSMVKYRTGAVGADDGYFTTHYHLPIGPGGAFESGGAGGGPSPSFMREKITESLNKVINTFMDPIKGQLPSPPPEWQGIPKGVFDKGQKALVDSVADSVTNLQDGLRTIWEAIRKIPDLVKAQMNGGDDVNAAAEAALYDTGGIMKHGQVAVNKSGRPERVLDPAMTRLFDKRFLPIMEEFVVAWRGGDYGYAATGQMVGDSTARDMVNSVAALGEWARSDDAKQFTESVQKSAEDAALGGAKSALAPYGLDPLVDLGTGVAKRVESAWDASGMDVGMQGRNIVVNIDAEEGQDTIAINQLQRLEKDVDWLKVNVKRKPKAAVTTRGGVM